MKHVLENLTSLVVRPTSRLLGGHSTFGPEMTASQADELRQQIRHCPHLYVSGYLETRPPLGYPKLAGADQSHAWVDVYLGSGIWMGIDPTNDKIVGGQYVKTAYGRGYDDIAPLKGVIFTNATETKMTVSVDVVPIH